MHLLVDQLLPQLLQPLQLQVMPPRVRYVNLAADRHCLGSASICHLAWCMEAFSVPCMTDRTPHQINKATFSDPPPGMSCLCVAPRMEWMACLANSETMLWSWQASRETAQDKMLSAMFSSTPEPSRFLFCPAARQLVSCAST